MPPTAACVGDANLHRLTCLPHHDVHGPRRAVVPDVGRELNDDLAENLVNTGRQSPIIVFKRHCEPGFGQSLPLDSERPGEWRRLPDVAREILRLNLPDHAQQASQVPRCLLGFLNDRFELSSGLRGQPVIFEKVLTSHGDDGVGLRNGVVQVARDGRSQVQQHSFFLLTQPARLANESPQDFTHTPCNYKTGRSRHDIDREEVLIEGGDKDGLAKHECRDQRRAHLSPRGPQESQHRSAHQHGSWLYRRQDRPTGNSKGRNQRSGQQASYGEKNTAQDHYIDCYLTKRPASDGRHPRQDKEQAHHDKRDSWTDGSRPPAKPAACHEPIVAYLSRILGIRGRRSRASAGDQ